MLDNVKSRIVNELNSNDSNEGETEARDNEVSKSSDWKTCDFKSLPDWLQDNCYILKGHRPPLPSFRQCINSILRIHTESVNIWTHLFGSVLFIAISLHVAVSNFPLTDKLGFLPFLIGAVLCHGFSTTHHTFHCHSISVSKFIHYLDYCGIIFLIIGSFISATYFAFCDNLVRIIYISGALILGTCTMYISLSERFRKPLYRPVRAGVFVILGLCGVVPGLHFVLLNSWNAVIMYTTPLILSSALYIGGAAIYAARVPEKIYPGKFDIWGQSHQIFHVLVTVATLINYLTLSAIATLIQSNNGNCSKQFNFEDPNYSYSLKQNYP